MGQLSLSRLQCLLAATQGTHSTFWLRGVGFLKLSYQEEQSQAPPSSLRSLVSLRAQVQKAHQTTCLHIHLQCDLPPHLKVTKSTFRCTSEWFNASLFPDCRARDVRWCSCTKVVCVVEQGMHIVAHVLSIDKDGNRAAPAARLHSTFQC